MSHAPDTSASGTFSAPAHEEQLGAGDSDFAPAGSSEDDEDVSLDELMMSDSSDEDEEEEEATDIHPGLSEAVLAESLRVAGAPSLVAAAGAALSEETESVPASSELELDASASSPANLNLALDAEAAQAAAEAAQAVAAGEEEVPVARVEEVSVLATELPVEGERAEPADPAAPEEAALGEAVSSEAVSSEDVPLAARAPESAPVQDEPTRPDAAPAEVIEAAPESEAEVISSVAIETEVFELDVEEPLVAEDIDLDEGMDTAEPSASVTPVPEERRTVPETLAAKRRDAPLPSFDIPDLEALSAASTAATAVVEPRSRGATRPVALPPLEEIAEDDDDDDAVTHMGLPAVPEAANDFPAPGGFQVADPAIAALEGLDADISRGDSRRATTRVIPRVDPKSIPQKPRLHAVSGPPLAERLSGMLRLAWDRVLRFTQPENVDAPADVELSPSRQRFGWMLENVLPPLSLVLFGSGLGAGVIMLVEPGRGSEASAQSQTVQALQESGHKGPLTLADRARAGDGEALYKITNLPQGERTSALTLALEAGYQSQKLREFREFSKSLTATSGSLPPASVSRMVDYATSSETMLAAFQELTQWAGPAGPDVLYAVWEKAAGGSRAASLAQQLLYSADQRAKATPALVVALDLRSAANCDDYLRVLPAVVRSGDQRSSATLRALRHNDGCGADGQQDCYACLRDNSLLEDALKAIETR